MNRYEKHMANTTTKKPVSFLCGERYPIALLLDHLEDVTLYSGTTLEERRRWLEFQVRSGYTHARLSPDNTLHII